MTAPFDRLYGSWKDYCEARGERPGSGKAFSQTLRMLGFVHRKEVERKKAGFGGLRLRQT